MTFLLDVNVLVPLAPAMITTSCSWLQVVPDPCIVTLPAMTNASRSVFGIVVGLGYPQGFWPLL